MYEALSFRLVSYSQNKKCCGYVVAPGKGALCVQKSAIICSSFFLLFPCSSIFFFDAVAYSFWGSNSGGRESPFWGSNLKSETRFFVFSDKPRQRRKQKKQALSEKKGRKKESDANARLTQQAHELTHCSQEKQVCPPKRVGPNWSYLPAFLGQAHRQGRALRLLRVE